MEKVQLGTRVKRLGIERTNVAEGTKCRVILLDDCPRVKYIGWDEGRKKRVELNQDLVIRFGFRPMTNFYYLIAKLNTDMNGNVVGNNFVVEYLQLSENLNNDLSDLLQEFGDFTSFTLSKVKKTGPNGQDFSYIKVTPSNYTFDDTLLEAINSIKNDASSIESMWDMIDKTTSMSAEEYLKLIEGEGNAKQIPASQPKQIPASQPKQIPASQPTSQPKQIQSDNSFGSEFSSDDFSDGF